MHLHLLKEKKLFSLIKILDLLYKEKNNWPPNKNLIWNNINKSCLKDSWINLESPIRIQFLQLCHGWVKQQVSSKN